MNKTILFLGFLVFTTAIFFSSSVAAKNSQSQTMRGKVASITKSSESDKEQPLATIFVERMENSPSNIDKAYLLVTKETKIYTQQGNVRKKAKFDEIKSGDVVFARLSDAPTIMIYPMRIAATEIVIERKSKKSKGK
ncbi:MAG: hypothetical protein M3209_03880 [Acidobacteriota bacterium]|nr:hypothetical protein [Acidobacteriota bacterium]